MLRAELCLVRVADLLEVRELSLAAERRRAALERSVRYAPILVRLADAGDAEVHEHEPPVLVHEDVGGLDILVDDAEAMQVLEREGQLRGAGGQARVHRRGVTFEERAGLDGPLEVVRAFRRPFDPLHQAEQLVALLVHVVDAEDVRMRARVVGLEEDECLVLHRVETPALERLRSGAAERGSDFVDESLAAFAQCAQKDNGNAVLAVLPDRHRVTCAVWPH